MYFSILNSSLSIDNLVIFFHHDEYTVSMVT